MCTLLGCTSKIVNEHINDPINQTGDLEYYVGLDEETIREKCLEKHIEVSGTVSDKSYSLFYIGDKSGDSYYFCCNFDDSSKISEINEGDIVTVQGVCTSILANWIEVYGCTIVSVEHAADDTTENKPETTAKSETKPSKDTDTTTKETTDKKTKDTKKAADTTKPSETKKTADTTKPAHQHIFVAATCVNPKTCSCGATEGKANGHNWKAATCIEPKICVVCSQTEGSANGHSWGSASCTSAKKCSSCGISEGSPLGHSWKNATYSAPKTCTRCGATEGSALQIPGSENYHGHVYTGGAYSEKYHYESHCAGKNSHEITWEEVERRGLEPCGTCVLK